jgi:uncharacterized protein YecT (DUF1311 family)
MKFLPCALAVALAALGQPVFAQDTRSAELMRANRKLDSLYGQILDRLSGAEQDRLKRAQRVWLQFRDLDCKWAFDVEPLDCMIDRTENRVRELEQTSFTDKAGAYKRAKDGPKH